MSQIKTDGQRVPSCLSLEGQVARPVVTALNYSQSDHSRHGNRGRGPRRADMCAQVCLYPALRAVPWEGGIVSVFPPKRETFHIKAERYFKRAESMFLNNVFLHCRSK